MALLSEVEQESGQNIGLYMTGGLTLAGTPERWEWLQSNYRIFQSIGIDDCELLSPQEAQKRCPIQKVLFVSLDSSKSQRRAKSK